MKLLKKSIACMMSIVMFMVLCTGISAFSLHAGAETMTTTVNSDTFPKTGRCGLKLTWVLTDDGTLTISGEGTMDIYGWASLVPWHDYRSLIKNVIIEENVTNIGNYAFCSCSNLTSVSIPASITSIDERAFMDCSNLASVDIPEGVTTIGERAFGGCKSLTSIVIPSSVIRIWTYAFIDCDSLESIAIKNPDCKFGNGGLTFILSLSFSGTIYGYRNSTAEKYASDCHYQFNFLNWFPETTETSTTTSTTMTTTTTTTTTKATTTTTRATAATTTTTVDPAVFPKRGKCGDSVGWTLTEDGILSISGNGDMKFQEDAVPWRDYRNLIKSVTFSNGVTSIENFAFCDCSNLTSVSIPSGIYSIGKYAFAYCNSLTSCKIPSSVLSIGKYAFFCCSNLTSISIPSCVTNIEIETFSGCSNLTSVVIPSSVICIESTAFAGCGKLTSIVIPSSVTSIGDYSFYNCDSLTSVAIENRDCEVNDIFDSTFAGTIYGYANSSAQAYAEEHSYPFKVLDAFYETTKISTTTTVTTAKTTASTTTTTTITTVIADAFPKTGTCGDKLTWKLTEDGTLTISGEGNMNDFLDPTVPPNLSDKSRTVLPWQDDKNIINNIIIEKNVTSIGTFAFFDCSNLTSVTMQSSITRIGISAFGACSKLTSIVIPEGVTSIENCAFEYCSALTSVVIPDSVANIRKSVFFNCECLTSVAIKNPACELNEIFGSESLGGKFSGIIYGNANSTAQAYAEEHGYSFEVLDAFPEENNISGKGDVNRDGSVDIMDVIEINKAIFGKGTLTEEQLKAADINGNNIPDSTDSLIIMKYIIKLITSLD